MGQTHSPMTPAALHDAAYLLLPAAATSVTDAFSGPTDTWAKSFDDTDPDTQPDPAVDAERVRRIIAWHHARVPEGRDPATWPFAHPRDAAVLLRALGASVDTFCRAHHAATQRRSASDIRGAGLPWPALLQIAAHPHPHTTHDLADALTGLDAWTVQDYAEMLSRVTVEDIRLAFEVMARDEIRTHALAGTFDPLAVRMMAALQAAPPAVS